jgi:hypothetical protein
VQVEGRNRGHGGIIPALNFNAFGAVERGWRR